MKGEELADRDDDDALGADDFAPLSDRDFEFKPEIDLGELNVMVVFIRFGIRH